MQLDFDGLCRWLQERLGRPVFASTQGAADDAGNTRLSVQGELARAEGEVVLMDARPGRVEVFTVAGVATLVLLEGDFVVARTGALGEGLPAVAQAVFRDLMVVVGDVPAPGP